MAVVSMCLFVRPVLRIVPDLFCFVEAVILFLIVPKSPGFTPTTLSTSVKAF